MIYQGAEKDAIFGISATGYVYNDPKQGRAGFVTLIRISLSQDGQCGVEALQESNKSL